MLHIRLDPDLHRTIRLIVAEQDTTLQDWVAHTLREAVNNATTDGGRRNTDC
jgi:predicted HicB family RNase H-like nuclease